MKVRIAIEQEYDINDDLLFLDDDPFFEENKDSYDTEARVDTAAEVERRHMDSQHLSRSSCNEQRGPTLSGGPSLGANQLLSDPDVDAAVERLAGLGSV